MLSLILALSSNICPKGDGATLVGIDWVRTVPCARFNFITASYVVISFCEQSIHLLNNSPDEIRHKHQKRESAVITTADAHIEVYLDDHGDVLSSSTVQGDQVQTGLERRAQATKVTVQATQLGDNSAILGDNPAYGETPQGFTP